MKAMFLGGHSHGSIKDLPECPPEKIDVPVPFETHLDSVGQPKAFQCFHRSDTYKRYQAAAARSDGTVEGWWWYYLAPNYSPTQTDLNMTLVDDPYEGRP